MSADVTLEDVRMEAGEVEPEEEIDLAPVGKILASLTETKGMLIPVLQIIQKAMGTFPRRQPTLQPTAWVFTAARYTEF